MVMNSNGFASMRITIASAVWANGKKVPPMVIHKSCNKTKEVKQTSGPILVASQLKGLIKWINCMFPLLNMVQGNALYRTHAEPIFQKTQRNMAKVATLSLLSFLLVLLLIYRLGV